MPRPNEREIDESFERAGFGPDSDDEELLRHVFEDEVIPPQGLHRRGYNPADE